jgi:hypothetical protein
MIIPDRPDRVPDSIEPLVGYRAWSYWEDFGGWSLCPISSQDRAAWDGANRCWVSATCAREMPEWEQLTPAMRARLDQLSSKLGYPLESFKGGPHSIPGEECACGFYAMKEFGEIWDSAGPGLVFGRVQLAGKVLEYTSGYRAERARIAALIPFGGNERPTMRLANDLGLPIEPPILRWSDPGGFPPAA